MPTDIDLTGFTLEDLEDALESGLRASLAGRQQKRNIEPEMKKARPAFRRRLRALAKAKR